jgi:hypothetical protein
MVTKEAKEDKEVSRVHVLANAATPLYGQLQKKAVLDLAQLREMLVDIHDGMHLFLWNISTSVFLWTG